MPLRTLVRRCLLPFAVGIVASCGSALATPLTAVSFLPTQVAQTVPSRLAITISDSGPLTNINLAAGAFTLPAGLSISGSVAPADQCGGTLVANVGDATLSLAGGAAPSGFCAIYVYVDTPSAGSFTATLDAGAITTDQGVSIAPWSDTLTVTPTQFVTTTADSGTGSLRDAINYVNGNCGGPYHIAFAIDTAGRAVIQPATALPAITCGGTVIDGYTQGGTALNGSPQGCTSPGIVVELSGALCGAGCNGLEFSGSGNVVRGLAIHSWGGSGITVGGSAQIVGNIIGADSSGSVPRANSEAGIRVTSGSATIGADDGPDRNLIVANVKGIWIEGGSNTIDGNQIGGQPSCAPGNGNGVGIYVAKTATSRQIVANNLIRDGAGAGISVEAGTPASLLLDGNSIYNNKDIGIDLKQDGATANDESAPPYSANGIPNYPVITGITTNVETTTVTGYLKSTPNATATVSIYENSAVRPGITEGESRVGTQSPVALDASGFGTFSVGIPGTADNLSALAVMCGDGCYATSEFSPTVTKASLIPPVGPVLSASPSPMTMYGFFGYGITDQPVVLTNTGDQDLVFNVVAPFTVAGDYTITTNSCATLAPGGTCSLVIRFVPTASGARPGTLTILSNDPASPTVVDINGYGLLPPVISIVTPITPVGGSTTNASLDVSNPNPLDTPVFTGVTGTLTLPSGFSVDPSVVPSSTCVGGNVPAGATCTLYSAQLIVPATPGAYTFQVAPGALNVTGPVPFDNDRQPATTFTVTVVAGSLSVSPTSLAFGTTTVGASSASQAVTILTTSLVPVPVASIAPTAGFTADASACLPAIPTSGCTVLVTFTPAAAGAATGTLLIDAGGGTYTVGLAGTGAPVPAPLATLSAASLAFGSRTVGTTSPPSTVTLTNGGTAALAIDGIGATGDFGFTSTCGASVAPGGNCAIDVTFTPLVGGARSGSLSVSTNAAGSPHVVTLSGTGLLNAVGTASPSTFVLDFGSQAIGEAGAAQRVTVTNTGAADLTLGFEVTGPFAMSTRDADGCGGTLAVGAVCAVAVTFTPAVVGSASGALLVTSNGANPRVVVNLYGNGVAGPPPRALGLPDRIDFGSQPFGARSDGHPLAIANLGAQAVTIADLAATGDFSVDDGCPTVPAHSTCTVMVYFTPTARGARSGAVEIRVASETQAYSVALAGDGGPNPEPLLTVTPLHIGFGNALVGPVGPVRTIRLSNPGEVPVSLGTILPLGDFLFASHCAATLAPAASCTVDVTFYARLVGVRSATLTVPSGAGNGPHRVDLSGVGCSLPNAARTRIPQLVCSP